MYKHKLPLTIIDIESSAYFNSTGFQSSCENIPAEYAHLSDFNNITPFIPFEVKDYVVSLLAFWNKYLN